MKKIPQNDEKFLTIRIYADIEFVEEISPEYTDIGSWESIPLIVKGEPVNVDFNEFYASIDKKNCKIIHCEWRDPDFESFGNNFCLITKEALDEGAVSLSDEGFDRAVIAERYAFDIHDDDLDIPQVGVVNAAIVSPFGDFKQYDLVVDGEWKNMDKEQEFSL